MKEQEAKKEVLVQSPQKRPRFISAIRSFLDSETAGGNILMAVAALALIVANSSIGSAYFETLNRSTLDFQCFTGSMTR